ncbi:MAG: alpha,alpha-trehalose-phosphate synthase (UDP-forming) [Gammaproteobacteria bacterium]
MTAGRQSPTEGYRAGLDGAGRLILVSNREPYFLDGEGRRQRAPGGLVSALEPVMRHSGGAWLAWNPGADGQSVSVAQVPDDDPCFTLRRVPVTPDEIKGFYDGCANRALWPLCHYAFEACHFDPLDWRAYVEVNRRFARHVAATAGPDDIVWIHDYHFFLLPRLLRQRGVSGPIAFFLHTPFPNAECFAIFPWRREVLEGLLGADLIGFHTAGYQRNFLRSVRKQLGVRVDEKRGEIHWRGRTVRTGAFPLGVDHRSLRKLADSPAVRRNAAAIREAHGGRRLILSVDRLDYSKGLLEKLAAIEALLERHPEYRGQVEFMQIAVPSRIHVVAYRQLKRQVDEAVGRINGRFGEVDWSPVHYFYRYFPLEELVARYVASDVAMVAPRRDGMNLVSKEYVACRTAGDGVLVLSEFAGSACELAEGAILVNPFDTPATAGALHAALTMPATEQARRMLSMRAVVSGSDVHDWVRHILAAVRGPDNRHRRSLTVCSAEATESIRVPERL